MPGCEALLCAEERYGAEEAIFLEKAVDIQIPKFFLAARGQPCGVGGTQRGREAPAAPIF